MSRLLIYAVIALSLASAALLGLWRYSALEADVARREAEQLAEANRHQTMVVAQLQADIARLEAAEARREARLREIAQDNAALERGVEEKLRHESEDLNACLDLPAPNYLIRLSVQEAGGED